MASFRKEDESREFSSCPLNLEECSLALAFIVYHWGYLETGVYYA